MRKIIEVPYIRFPQDWEIQIVPAYLGIHAQFRVKLPTGTVKNVVLLHNKEGYAYWLVTPDNSTGEDKVDVDDIIGLLEVISIEA